MKHVLKNGLSVIAMISLVGCGSSNKTPPLEPASLNFKVAETGEISSLQDANTLEIKERQKCSHAWPQILETRRELVEFNDPFALLTSDQESWLTSIQLADRSYNLRPQIMKIFLVEQYRGSELEDSFECLVPTKWAVIEALSATLQINASNLYEGWTNTHDSWQDNTPAFDFNYRALGGMAIPPAGPEIDPIGTAFYMAWGITSEVRVEDSAIDETLLKTLHEKLALTPAQAVSTVSDVSHSLPRPIETVNQTVFGVAFAESLEIPISQIPWFVDPYGERDESEPWFFPIGIDLSTLSIGNDQDIVEETDVWETRVAEFSPVWDPVKQNFPCGDHRYWMFPDCQAEYIAPAKNLLEQVARGEKDQICVHFILRAGEESKLEHLHSSHCVDSAGTITNFRTTLADLSGLGLEDQFKTVNTNSFTLGE